MSELKDVLHWLRPSNWAGVESHKAAQTLVVITELRAENERLREALCQIITHQSLLTELADQTGASIIAREALRQEGGADDEKL